MGLEFAHPQGAKYVMRAPVRPRGVGDLLDARPAGAAVQAGHPAPPGAVRGPARPHRGRRSARRGPRCARRRRAATRSRHERAPRSLEPTCRCRSRRGVPRARADARAGPMGGSGFRDATTAAASCASSRRSRQPPRATPAATPSGRSRETGFGVVEHKVVKNQAVLARHRRRLPRPRLRDARGSTREHKIVEVPRPAGVVLALTPSTNPVSTVYFKVLLALMTRNAVVVSPHPLAKECCTDAARMLAEAAVAAGAPDGVVQVVEAAVDPADRGADDRRAHRRHPRHRRRRRRARGLLVRQPGASASVPATCRCSSTRPPT